MSFDIKVDFGALGNGNDDSSQIQQALDAAPAGSTVIIPATTLSNYLIYNTLSLTKSLHIKADRGVRLINSTGGSLFECFPTQIGSVFTFEGMTIASGNIAIHMSSSTSAFGDEMCVVKDVRFETCNEGVVFQGPEARLRVEDCTMHSGAFGVRVEADGNFDRLLVRDSHIQDMTRAGVSVKKSIILGSGSIFLSNLSLVGNATAVDLSNVTGSSRIIFLASNTADVIVSGSSELGVSFVTGSTLT